MIFKSDPAAALDKTRGKLTSVEENIAALRAKRAEVLLTAEDADAIVAIDKAIEAEQANAVIYKDRIKALQEECRRALFQQRQGERSRAIERIKKKLAKREATGLALQEAIESVGRLYAQLMAPEEVEIDWPFSRPGFGFAAIDRRTVDKETAWALYGITKEHRVPEPSSVGLGVIGIRSIGIDGAVKAQNESIISRLETAPIADDLLAEPAA